MSNELYHYGTKRHSGRYPYGSGENPYQHESKFLNDVRDLREQGLSDKDIYERFGMNSSEFRSRITIENARKTEADATHALELKDKGYSNVEIGKMLGVSEGTIRRYLKPTFELRKNKVETLANVLKDQVAEKTYLDVGKGVEVQLGVAKTQMKPALSLLKDEGYKVSYIKVEQATNPGKFTSVQVLTKDDVEWKDIYKNRDKIMSPTGVYFEDKGTTLRGIKPPVSIDSKRIAINYAEDGGNKKDGVIEIRRGVEDISLGQSNYAQVRIAVDGTHYLKGMAMYSDDLPKGVDILFNTNKHKDIPMINSDPKGDSVLKKMKDDPDNPFGSTIRQFDYPDKDGKLHQSPINIVNDPGDWDSWSKTLSSQMLSKQSPSLAKRQLDLAYKEKAQEFDDICKLTNPAIKKRLLESFADDCDSAAVKIKAAPLPGQRNAVILPVTKLKDNEVYAPNYKNGEEVVLIRYPHGGTFEIPRLIVNNNNREGKKLLGNAPNAIGINSNVAELLSGADFDGDTVTIIPTRNQPIKTTKRLIENFDPKEYYRAYEGMPEVGPKTGFHKQSEMGKVSNLITDMTIKGATPSEIARAVRHSMTVIDAEKHNLDWRRSYEDNRIAELKEKYQGGKNNGASTLISASRGRYDVPQRKEYRLTKDTIDKQGNKIFEYAGESYVNKKGKTVIRTERSTKGAELDPFDPKINSGSAIEKIYANHSSKLKSLANEARKEYVSTPNLKYNPEAKKTYSKEVESLNSSLNIALKNKPNERKAQLVADKIWEAKVKDNPSLKEDKEEARKVKAQIIEAARTRAGTSHRKDRNIPISDREWEAIQSGAISHNKLEQILQNTDLDELKERATPRTNKRGMSGAAKSRARAMLAAGHSQAEVAEACGVSVTTLKNNGLL